LVQRRLDLVLVGPGTAERRRRLVRFAGDRRGGTHEIELFGLLLQPHLVQEGARVGDVARRRHAAPRLASNDLERPDHHLVVAPILTEGVVEPARVLEQLGEPLLQLVDRVRLVRSVSLPGPLDPRTEPGPGLSVGISSRVRTAAASGWSKPVR
jgi:hypothetical protein